MGRSFAASDAGRAERSLLKHWFYQLQRVVITLQQQPILA